MSSTSTRMCNSRPLSFCHSARKRKAPFRCQRIIGTPNRYSDFRTQQSHIPVHESLKYLPVCGINGDIRLYAGSESVLYEKPSDSVDRHENYTHPGVRAMEASHRARKDDVRDAADLTAHITKYVPAAASHHARCTGTR